MNRLATCPVRENEAVVRGSEALLVATPLFGLNELHDSGTSIVSTPPFDSTLQVALQGLGSIVAVEERSLTGTWDKQMLRRWHWRTKTGHLRGLGPLQVWGTTQTCHVLGGLVWLLSLSEAIAFVTYQIR